MNAWCALFYQFSASSLGVWDDDKVLSASHWGVLSCLLSHSNEPTAAGRSWLGSVRGGPRVTMGCCGDTRTLVPSDQRWESPSSDTCDNRSGLRHIKCFQTGELLNATDHSWKNSRKPNLCNSVKMMTIFLYFKNWDKQVCRIVKIENFSRIKW